ncbi:MAG: sprT domain-containing protein [Flavobacteriaceae bacterium]|nr:sprT domain-containing protein [Flavobacteriaceae bacterium]
MEEKTSFLQDFVPKAALPLLSEYLLRWQVNLLITPQRVTKHGDFRSLPRGGHQITVNEMENPYRFLITTLHEISHLIAFQDYGRGIKPHGKEWKSTFKKIMLPFVNPKIFPEELLGVVAEHFIDPKASTDTDLNLVLALNKFEPESEKKYIFELEQGVVFEIHNGRKFVRGKKHTKRYECQALYSHKVYLFSPHAQVTIVE